MSIFISVIHLGLLLDISNPIPAYMYVFHVIPGGRNQLLYDLVFNRT